MSRKRRMFDIEVPAEEPETFPAGKDGDKAQRRGPMATAIAETAESTRDRAQLEARIRNTQTLLTYRFRRAKSHLI